MSTQLVATYMVVNAVNVSAYMTNCDFPLSSEMLDATTMIHSFKVNRPGLTDASISSDFIMDYAVIDALFDALRGSAGFSVEIRPTAAAVSATNPKWTGTFCLENYQPISGQRGALAMSKISLKPASDIVRAIA
jgi:hypothetical protein